MPPSLQVPPKMTTAAATDEGLSRGLSRWNALAVVMSAVIGTGIFIRPASIAQLVRTGPSIMIVWFATGLMSIAGALTYADLAARIPRSVGEYAFLRVTLGELPAFLFGWMRLTLGVATISALAVAFTVFLGDLFPLGGPWLNIPLPSAARADISIGARQAIAVLVIAILALLNVRGVANAGRFQSWVTALKVTGLVGLIAAIAVFAPGPGTGGAAASAPFAAAAGPSAFAAAMLAANASFNGWANVAMLGGELRDARRSLPWALVVGITAVTLLYLGINAAYLHALTLDDILTANSTAHPGATSVASRAAAAALGPRSAVVLTALFLVSALGTLHCNLLAVPRVLFAMANDGLMPGMVARVAPRARTPYVAIVALSAMGCVLAVLGSYDRLTNMSSLGTLLFYALNALGYLFAGNRLPALDGRRRLPLWIPAAFMITSAALVAAVIARGTTEILAALLLMALGVPAFLIFRLRRHE